MNPKLIKFAVSLQSGEKVEKKEKENYTKMVGKYFFNIYHTAPSPVKVENNK